MKTADDLSPAALLIANALLDYDIEHWDLADSLEDDEVETLASASEKDIDAALAFVRTKLVKGVKDALEMT